MSATLPLTARTTARTTARVAGPATDRAHLRVVGPVVSPVAGPVAGPAVGQGPAPVARAGSDDAAAVRAGRSWLRDEAGATTAEYATVTGCGVGFAALLFKFLTSQMGQELLRLIFTAIKSLLPF